MEIHPIAYVRTDFPTKFGVPRQSGLTSLVSRVVFVKEYASEEAIRGIEGFEYIWLIWGFDRSEKTHGLTVRPPRLGGNKRMGVFATRSPYRPNPIGLSSVKLLDVEKAKDGLTLLVAGADVTDGTPVYDVKPYLPFTDSHAQAKAGFSDETRAYELEVTFDTDVKEKDETMLAELKKILALDPRPRYHDEGREYGFPFAGHEIKFFVRDNVLHVTDIEKSM